MTEWKRPSFEKLRALAEALEKVAEVEAQKAQDKVEAIKKIARIKNGMGTTKSESSDTSR